ncbi:MAG: transcription termination factor Rho [Phycisphaerales bacterium]|nr:transcription termination factor Rho [Phycisphaerales bacterium]
MAQQRPAEATAKVDSGIVEGVLEVLERGGGVLRDPKRNFGVRPTDPTIAPDVIRKFALQGGEMLTGRVVRDGRGARLQPIETIEGVAAKDYQPPTPLVDTTAIDPTERLHFDTPGGPLSMRVMELFTPIGKGQRGLIVAPPRTGKTILLQQMAHGIAVNHPEVYMVVLLIDERPEEVTEMRRNVRGEVFSSSNDHDVASHVRIARLVIERAKRMVEAGRHIVVLLDSITRLARAFNSFVGSSGRTMTGGLDIKALQEPKQIFGCARNIEHGGSLTIVGTALIDTGSRADNFIFEEFKGTGNMELVLNRDMANQRVWPAMELQLSGTRKEEKLLDAEALRKVYNLRRALNDLPPPRAMAELLKKMEPSKSLEDFLASLK